MVKKVYISGPISGRKREVYLAEFAKAEEWLTLQGYRVVNPTRLAPCRYPWLYKLIGYRMTLLYDLLHLWQCTHIVFLPDWTNSRGALIEHRFAFKHRIAHLSVPEWQEFITHMLTETAQGDSPRV